MNRTKANPMLPLLAVVAAIILPAHPAGAQTPPDQPRSGEVHEIRRVVDSTSTSTGMMGSSGSSHDADALVERVIAVRDGGVELEYDLPDGASADERASDWKFPVRVLRPPHGPLQLLNAAELERRVDRWLTAGEMTRQACGHWIFTWNAFQIECDPQSAIPMLERFLLWPDELRDGASWQQEGSRAPVVLRQQRRPSGGAIFVARMEVDPEAARRERVRSDIVVAEIMHQGLTPEAALQAHAADGITGTIVSTFELDAAHHLQRRTTVTELEVRGADGRGEHRTITETVERRRVRAAGPGA
jgi:hypothetical protein